MKDLMTQIQGFPPHDNTKIIWPNGIVAVVGHNGAGKTTSVTGSFACRRGYVPGKMGGIKSSLYDWLQAGTSREGLLRDVFESLGQIYFAERRCKLSDGGNTATICRLWKLDAIPAWDDLDTISKSTTEKEKKQESDERYIAGPKSGPFEAKINALMGEAEVELSTRFATQRAVGDLCLADAAQRRTIFMKLLECDKHQALADRFGKSALKAEASTETLEAQIAGEPDFTTLIAGEEMQRQVAQIEIVTTDQKKERQEFERGATQTKLAELLAGEGPLRAKIERHEAAVKRADELAAQSAGLKKEIEALEVKAAKMDRARKDCAELAAKQIERDRLRGLNVIYAKWVQWRGELEGFEITARSLARELAALRAHPGLSPEDAALADALPSIEAEYRAARLRNEELGLERARLSTRIRDEAFRQRAASERLAKLEAKAAKKPETPAPPEVCAVCPLMKDWAALPKEIEEARIEMRGAEAVIAELDPKLAAVVPDVLLDPIADKGAKARAAVAARAKAETAIKSVAVKEAEAGRVAAQIEELKGTEPSNPGDQATTLAANQLELDRLAGAQERVKAAEEAAANLAEKTEEEYAKRGDWNDAKDDVADLAPEAAESKVILADLAGAIGEAQATLARAETEIARLAKEREGYQREQARAEAEIKSLENRARIVGERRSEAKAYRDKADLDRTLQRTFGPKGIQALLIDQAAPQLERIATKFFKLFFRDRARLRIVTQSAGRKGDLQEDFRILISDDKGERDVADGSGGEQRIFQTILRIAVALWQAELRGIKPESVVIDEAFDALDVENMDAMIELLQELERMFGQVLCITHSEEIAARLPHRIVVSNNGSGARVEVAA